MREYKDSGIEWIGKIPETWEVDIAKHAFKQRREKGNDVECQLLAATQKNGMYPQHLLEGVVKVAADTDLNMFKTVHKNDYVISLRSFQGGFEMSDYEGVCSPAYQVFYATRRTANQYYKYLFKSDAFIQEINSLTVGIREGKNILYDDFALLPIPIPTVDDQQHIADFLDSKCGEIDSLIALQEQMIEKLKAYKQSVITEAVTKGLDPNAKLAPSGIDWIGEIPESWEVCRFKSYIHLISEKSVETTGIKVNLENIESKSGRYIPTDSKYEGDGTSFKKGDVLFGKLRPYLAKILAPEFDGAAIGDIYVFRPTDRINTCFLKYMLLSDTFITIVDSSTYGTKMPRANWEFISCVPVVVPSLDEQRVIASFLDEKCIEIDRLLDLKQQKIEALKDYKKSVIYEAVTGKTIIE